MLLDHAIQDTPNFVYKFYKELTKMTIKNDVDIRLLCDKLQMSYHVLRYQH
nr:MAG TPA: hypothetical protein [Caudoviricetes sp.]